MEKIKNATVSTVASEKKNQQKVKPKLEDFVLGVHNDTIHDKTKKYWKDFLITKAPIDVPPLLKFDEIPIWTSGNHSLIIGKKKSRKTLFLVWMVGKYLGEGNDILWCDTEQGSTHVWKTLDRVNRFTEKQIQMLSLRGLNPDERLNIIEQAIIEGGFKVVLIDGIRDLLSNINDPDQCTDLITWIEKMTITYNVHIANVLHLNKTDNNPRGHIGSELLNKAEITIELELDEKANCTIVKCESTRDIPFQPFAFTHNIAGLPEVISMPIKGQCMNEVEQKKRLSYIFEDGQLKYNELIQGIKDHFNVGKTKAEKLKAEFQRSSWIIKNGPDRSPSTVYKLMVAP